MSLFRRRRKLDWHDRFHLAEDFRGPERVPGQYPVDMEGLEISGKSLGVLLEEFSRTERPLFHLYLPRREREERREILLQRLGRNSLSLLDLSSDREAESFFRGHSRVRFGFEHRNYTYIFETEVIARLEGDDPLFLALKPETIYQERRSHQRYKLWPDFRAYFRNMPVLDISQRGLKVFSEQHLGSAEALENEVLALPPVHDSQTGEAFYSGAEIKVPRAAITHELKQKGVYYYGLHFDQKWTSEQTKMLNDFLLALRKCFFQGGCE